MVIDDETAVSENLTETAPTEEIKTATCARCGCVSTLPEFFRKSGGKMYCPVCALNNEVRNAKILAALAGFFIVLDFFNDGSRYGWGSWRAWSLLITILIVVISLVFHELSHALAARLLGGQVFGIQLGIGRQILQRWFKDFFLGISLLPVSGVCFAGFASSERLRLRYAGYISGGLLFHVVTLFITISLFSGNGRDLPFLLTIIVTNGLLLLLNAWPRTATTAVGQSGTDGMLLWRLATGKLTERELRRNYYRLAATFAHQRQNNEQTRTYIREGLLLDPADELLENLRVYLLLNEEDKLEEAHDAWKAIVESDAIEEVHVLHQAIFFNNYAWTTLMLQPAADSLEVARHYSEKAFQMAPWITVLKGTFAAVLVEQGQHMEGVELALAAANEHKANVSPGRNKSIAANLATAALGYFRMGGNETAVEYLEQAKALSMEERMVQKAVAEIEGVGTAVQPTEAVFPNAG